MGGDGVEHWEYLKPDGLRFVWDDTLFRPGTDSFLLSSLPKLSAGLLETLYAITPNETEAEAISGIRITDEHTAEEAARKIASMGVCNVIITLGAKGALVFDGEHCEVVPAYKIQAVDTTAAGDVFNGALVVALSEGRTLPEAVRFACKASAISVTRPGAQNSVPYRTEVDVFNL